jgi:inactivated superfamily I helicase
MKLNQAGVGDTVLLPVKVLAVSEHASYRTGHWVVELDEVVEKTVMTLHPHTEVHPFVVPDEAARPIEVDDIVFVEFEDGQWRVADRYQDQVFLTPHMDIAEALSDYPRAAMVADVEDCYHVSPKGGW